MPSSSRRKIGQDGPSDEGARYAQRHLKGPQAQAAGQKQVAQADHVRAGHPARLGQDIAQPHQVRGLVDGLDVAQPGHGLAVEQGRAAGCDAGVLRLGHIAAVGRDDGQVHRHADGRDQPRCLECAPGRRQGVDQECGDHHRFGQHEQQRAELDGPRLRVDGRVVEEQLQGQGCQRERHPADAHHAPTAE